VKRTVPLMFAQFCLLVSGVSAQQKSITLPVGTEISISTVDRINSKKADARKEYAASIDDPVIVDGVTVIPAKASAFLRVSDVQDAGFSRRASLATSLVAVMINGQRVAVNTDKIDSKSGSQVKRTATGAAVGAGTGAAIGGAVGGGAGAGIGAGVGAAGGAVAGKIFGKAVEIAPETRFTYRLTQEVVVDSVAVASNEPAAPRLVRGPAPERQPAADAEPSPSLPASVPPSTPPAAPPPPAPPTERPAPVTEAINPVAEPDLVGVLFFQNEFGALQSLEQNRGIPRKRISGNSQQTYWEMPGARSPVRLKSGQKMLFVIRLENGIDPTTFSLFPLETKYDSRRTGSDPRNKTAPMTLQFSVSKISESTYSLTPSQDLAAGEYAFSPKNSDDAYCFGVDR
jgi:uncharacterized protein YcfJ